MSKLKLFHVKRTDGGGGYDTYSDFVVAATSKKQAEACQPNNFPLCEDEEWDYGWVPPKDCVAIYLADVSPQANVVIKNKQVICSSFHAG